MFKATMNVQLMEDEYAGDDMIIYDPDTIEDPPEGTTLDDFTLSEDEIMKYVNLAADIRRGLKLIREELGAFEREPESSGRFDNLQVSNELT